MNTTTANPPFDERGEPPVEEQFDDATQQCNAVSLGMWVFLATEILFFGVLFASYTVMRVLHADGFAEGSNETDLLLGSVETAVLLVSSVTVMLGIRALKLDQRRLASLLLYATAGLGLAFLIIHGFEYHSEWNEHLVPGVKFLHPGAHSHAVEMFFVLYFTITGFHSLHLMIGVLVVLVLAIRVSRGAFGPLDTNTLEVAGLYWHLVDIIWIFVFPLLYLLGRMHG